VTTPNDVEATSVGLSVGAPVMPRVNLMPPEIAEAARFRRFQLAMGGAVVAAAAVVAALYMQAHSDAGSAQAQLDSAKSQQAVLNGQLSSLQSVQDIYTQVSSRETTLSQAMSGEIRWSRYMNDLSLRLPDHVWLTNVTATETAASAAAGTTLPTTATATVSTPGAIGTVSFAGVAFAHDDVATWLDTLAKERGFANPYFTNAAETPIGPKQFVTFASSVDLTNKAESGRYSKPAGS
jgi:Tfp pilus assembly protein PilN